MSQGICGTCSSPIVVRDGKAFSVINRSFVEERDRYREALEQIRLVRGVSDARSLAREALEGGPR